MTDDGTDVKGRGDQNYWSVVRHTALREAAHALGLSSVWRKILAAAAFVAVLAYLIWGSAGASLLDIVFRLLGIGYVLLFPVAFAFKFFGLPPKMHKEQADTIEHLKDELKPKLEIQFDQKEMLCCHKTYRGGDREDEAVVVAVVPRTLTSTPVKGCQGFLNSVWLLGPDRNWQPTSFVNRLPLEWTAAGHDPLEIDNETNQALNIFYVAKRDPRVHCLTSKELAKDKAIFEDRNNRVFRFDIVVKEAGGTSAKISLRAELGEVWDDVNVTRIDE